MTNQEFFAQRLKSEIAAFVNVIRALPEDQLEYKPHERNTPAGTLAWQITTEMQGVAGMLKTGDIDYKMGDRPALAQVADEFEQAANMVVENVTSVSDERWGANARFIYGGNVVWESTMSDLAWGFLFDMVHHRGQLSAYLRPMGGKVPAIYGPSGDVR